MSTLERRIAAALTSDIPSADIAALVAETEAAISQVEAAAEAEREMALDPLASPDAAKARTAMEDAAFTRDRLRTVLPRLQERLQQVQAAEYAARWEADFEEVEGRRNEMAQEYVATYPRLVAQFVDILHRAEAVDRDVSRVNGSAPAGEHRRLAEVELAARNLESFSTANPSIAKMLQLPDFEHSARLAWPPPTPSLAAQVAASMASMIRPHPGANWASEREGRTHELREEHERIIAHYDAAARAREEREAAEAQKRGKGAVA
jgi:hypothetical protein